MFFDGWSLLVKLKTKDWGNWSQNLLRVVESHVIRNDFKMSFFVRMYSLCIRWAGVCNDSHSQINSI